MDEARREWVELVRVREPARLGILRSVLEAAGVEHLVEGEQVQGLFPMATPGFFLDRGMGAVILVRPEDEGDARTLIEERVEPLEDPEGDG
jgi:hypothetical protein